MLRIKFDVEINAANGKCIAKGPASIMGEITSGRELVAAGIAIGQVIDNLMPALKRDEDVMMEFVKAVCKPFEEYAKGADKN